jgi:hypothetical protein
VAAHWARGGVDLFDGVVGRLLLIAGDPTAPCLAGHLLEVTARTGQLSYDAENMRRHAHTAADAGQRHEELVLARDLARRQGFTLLELRAALDDFELCGQPARAALVDVVGRMPAEGGAPELARAQELLAEQA